MINKEGCLLSRIWIQHNETKILLLTIITKEITMMSPALDGNTDEIMEISRVHDSVALSAYETPS